MAPRSAEPSGFTKSSRKQRSVNAQWPPPTAEDARARISAVRINDQSRADLKLSFMTVGIDKTNHILKIPKSISTTHQWSTCLVGYFLDDKMSFNLVNSGAFEIWGKSGLIDVLGNESELGFFFFRFISQDTRDAIMERGPWHLSSQPVFLKPWRKNMKLVRENHSKIPIWVRFYNLPMEYWTETGFSYVGSMIGKPLFVDKTTADCKRMSYARVCIEVDAISNFSAGFDLRVKDDDGSVDYIWIKVEYEYKPVKCRSCGSFGHDCSIEMKT